MEQQTDFRPSVGMQDFMEQLIAQFVGESRYGTARNYRRALRRLNLFTEGHRLPIDAVTAEWAVWHLPATCICSVSAHGACRSSTSPS